MTYDHGHPCTVLLSDTGQMYNHHRVWEPFHKYLWISDLLHAWNAQDNNVHVIQSNLTTINLKQLCLNAVVLTKQSDQRWGYAFTILHEQSVTCTPMHGKFSISCHVQAVLLKVHLMLRRSYILRGTCKPGTDRWSGIGVDGSDNDDDTSKGTAGHNLHLS